METFHLKRIFVHLGYKSFKGLGKRPICSWHLKEFLQISTCPFVELVDNSIYWPNCEL